VIELVPLSTDLSSALRWLRAGVRASLVPGERAEDYLPAFEEMVTSGTAHGRLIARSGTAIGLGVWEPPGPTGVFVLGVYLEPPHATVEAYRSALDAIEAVAGPIAFVLRPLVGLPEAAESELMRARGFERYGRSEMRFPPSREPPSVLPPDGVSFRPPVPADAPALASLNLRAYSGSLDRFLFLTDLDPVRDSERHIADVLRGGTGAFLADRSVAAIEKGMLVGACLVVRASYGPLLVNVMVDPAHQGRRIAQSMISASLRALRAAGENVAVLNVTEGNLPAVRAYEKLGFVRTIGPQWSWYSRARIFPDARPS